jgi:hypothetical protein
MSSYLVIKDTEAKLYMLKDYQAGINYMYDTLIMLKGQEEYVVSCCPDIKYLNEELVTLVKMGYQNYMDLVWMK